MSYLGFAKILVRDFLKNIDNPRILEVGLDRGQTTLPLIHNMCFNLNKFQYVGIDVKINDCLAEQLTQFEDITYQNREKSNKHITLYEINSLNWLHHNKDKGTLYDLILLDGDHNYYTVYNELRFLEKYTHNHSLIVCDDFNGRYASKDLFYKERDTHKDNKLLHDPVKLERQGVGVAIRDYLGKNNHLDAFILGNLEPCFIFRKDFLKIDIVSYEDNLVDMKMNFEFL